MNTQTSFTDTNNSAFSSIYNAYYSKMYAYGIAIGFCKHICKDAVQDVFCTICNSINNLESVENIESYLLHCIKNRLFDIYRNEKRMCCIDYDDNTKSCEELFLDKLIAKENGQMMIEEVNRLLEKLPPKHRKIILCRFNHNLKYNEIACIMNMSADAVKKQLYRSLKLMEQEIRSNIANCYKAY